MKRIGERVIGPEPLPVETVRDLLGVVRVLYALHRSKGNHGFARGLQHAGRQLRDALAIAVRQPEPGAHAEAWRLVDEAIGLIGRVQMNTGSDELNRAVTLAANRVKSRRHVLVDREAKRAQRIKRG